MAACSRKDTQEMAKKNKGKSGKKWQKNEPKRKKYDVKMIRDFLDHLKWEVRIAHFEYTSPPGATNDELVEQLAKYMKKYKVHGLLPYNAMPDDASQEVVDSFRSEYAQKFQKQIDALESLGDLFTTALLCASKGQTAVVNEISLADENSCYLVVAANGDAAVLSNGPDGRPCLVCCPDRQQAEMVIEEAGLPLTIVPISPKQAGTLIKATVERLGEFSVVLRRKPPRVVMFAKEFDADLSDEVDFREVLEGLDANDDGDDEGEEWKRGVAPDGD